MDRANTTRPVRDLAVDCYRVAALVLIVVGHWLIVCVTYHDGHFGWQNALFDMPWTRWLTWIFQAVPVFFLVAGYASAVSWTHRSEAGDNSGQTWTRRRLARVLGPTAIYVALMSIVVVALRIGGVPRSVLKFAGWALRMHLWFLVVYLVMVVLTPVAVAVQRRWGIMVPVALAAGVVAVEAAAVHSHLPYLRWLNFLVCWAVLYQLGIAWQGGLLAGRRPVLLAAGSAVALTLLIWLGPYPVSMIDTPGQRVQNVFPPTVAMLAFACAQAGLLVTLAPAVSRALRPRPLRRVLATANNNAMSLYLWHMLPVVAVTLVGYPSGLVPQPTEGTAQWWLLRLGWELLLGVVAAAEMALLWWGRRFFAAPLPTPATPLTNRWAEFVLLAGTLMAVCGLWFIASKGFAPAGRLPWVTELVFAAGLVLVAVRPARVTSERFSRSR